MCFKKDQYYAITQWLVFCLFALTILAKTLLFNWLVFADVEENYWMYVITSLPQKIVPALFIASFVFVTKRPIWTIVANLMIDIWIIANLFYFKANGYFLSFEVMTKVDNMDGFWDSLKSYFGWDIAIFPIITIIYSLLYPYVYPNQRKYGWMVVLVILALVINIGDQLLHKQHKAIQDESVVFHMHECLPFSHVFTYANAEWIDYNQWAEQYVRKFSVVSYFPACILYRGLSPLQKIEYIDIDKSRIEPFLSDKLKEKSKPTTNLIFILVESLESWPLNSIEGVDFMSNLKAISISSHSLSCRNLRSQVKHGNSADGQLIDITGLLPITDGVVCYSYFNNVYPSFAQCYERSAIINPWHGVWQQDQMTKAYHFQELIEPKRKDKWTDGDTANRIIQYMDTASQPFCVLGITISSHVPFSYGSNHPKYTIEGMPAQMNAYLNCLHYADSCIGVIYRHILQSDTLASNTTLVISGDHTIFRSHDKTLDDYALNAGIDFQTKKTYMPLVIYSPSLEGNVQIADTCYQMDIYPTIMHLIGCEDYYWKSFGINLLDVTACERAINEEQARELSDKLIRSNYFATCDNR